MEQLLIDISRQIVLFEPIKYFLIFVAVFIEGPLATVVAAALAAGGILNPGAVFVAAGLGNLAADLSWYSLGHAGRYSGVIHWLPWLRNQEKMISYAKEQMYTKPIRILIVSKLWLGIAVIPTLITAGLLQVPWYRLFPAALACEIVWTGCLVLTGYFGSSYLGRIENIMEGLVVFASVLLTIGLILVVSSRMSLTACKSSNGDTQ